MTTEAIREEWSIAAVMRRVHDKDLTLAKASRDVRDHLRVSNGETIRVLDSAFKLVAKTYRLRMVWLSQVAVMAASVWISSDPGVQRCSSLVDDALMVVKEDPFFDTLYKSKVPYDTLTGTEPSFTIWAPDMDTADQLSAQADACGLPTKWLVQLFLCGVLRDYGVPVLGKRYYDGLQAEFENGQRWIRYRADHVLGAILDLPAGGK